MRQPMEEPDYYALLGVSSDATEAEILRAFRREALVHHPDRGGDADAFRLLYRAREALLDADRRAAHDQRRRGAAAPPGRPGPPPGPDEGAADPFEWTQGAGPSAEDRRTGGPQAYYEPFPAYQAGHSWRRSDRFAWWQAPGG
ncbi:DnaJ domain-containing protein [Micromonospora sp. CA-263727]|uniref:DnaJ domain-containing protein n=1 Tax=Micromonospora sp. CA-263727 TaxID=3239967 RepID=UPI003D90C24C